MTGFVRLSAHGPGELEDWGPMPSADLIAGKGQQSGYLWLDDATSGLMVGVWSCSPMTGAMGPWSTNEVIVLIEGQVTIDHADGSSLDFAAGDAFVIPKGTVCSWRQAGDLKKFFVIHGDNSGLAAPDPAALRARKIDAAAPLSPSDAPPASLLSGPVPSCADHVAFTDLTGQLTAGVWSATPYQRKAVASPRHELMHIVEGSGTLSDGAERTETFATGDTLLVPLGAVTEWTSTVPVRKIFCSFTPGA
jgi:uncharacterized cupin superfamily protein